MEVEFIECRYKSEAKLSKAQIQKLPKCVGICATLQYIDSLPGIKSSIEATGRKVELLETDNGFYRGQILGCSKLGLANFEGVLFVGDGMFHPINIKMQFKGDVFVFNPYTHEFRRVGEGEVVHYRKRIKAAYTRFLSAKSVGVLISTKPGQVWNDFDKLESIFPEKRFYYLVFDNISLGELENFPFVEVFVNTACPRIGLDDSFEHGKPVLNISDLKSLHNKISTYR
ncbi:hypothetical protein DRJ48_01930 [Candidatus Woesearchaeota archaeon]|nr:diphthamide synthesis protein [Candidatus Woesearchaeota archaeon]RLE43069.1 MAG: hypothetical protein DRJ48_01930 [Candidatus Woesearchaeota archaeon]